MAGNYIQVDTFGWFDDILCVEDHACYVSVDSFGWWNIEDLAISPSANPYDGTYLNYANIPNQYITKCATSRYAGSVGNYNNERELFDLVVTEAYNKHGVCMDFYVTSYDKEYDKIWGEDNDRRFERRFEIMTFYNLPREERLWSKFGIEGINQFSIYASKRHFWTASQYNDVQSISNAFPPYIPKVGDYLYSKYNKYIYEIVEVKDEIMMNLLSKQHVWEFLVKPFKDEKIETTSLTSAAPIADFTNKDSDIFDVTDTIDEKKDDVNYNPPGTECNPNDPFGGW